MTLVSIQFLFFLFLCALVYFLVPRRWQWGVLLAESFLFYTISGPKFVPFLLFTILTTYSGGLWLGALTGKYKAELAERKAELSRDEKKALKRRHTGKKRLAAAVICIVNFGMLAVLKYGGFAVELVNGLLGSLSIPLLPRVSSLILPLGISFYTFQAMGYLLDVYRDKEPAEKNPFKLALFLSFFPQLIQGPISRHSELASQLTQPHRFDYDRARLGALLILWGFFKKLMIADRALVLSSTIFAEGSGYRGIYILLGAIAYSVRVYADFSGGIDIARGVAQILGIDMTPNFERPYFSGSVKEFWRRWHITLGAWFRDYVFYPLSLSRPLSRLGKWVRTHINNSLGKVVPVILSQFVVFILIGLWHGANVKYIAFGLYHGILIDLGILLEPKLQWVTDKLKLPAEALWFRVFRILRTFLLIILGRILTMGATLRMSLSLYAAIFPLNNLNALWNGDLFQLGLSPQEMIMLLLCIGLLFAVSLMQERGIHLREAMLKKPMVLRWAAVLILIFMILIFGVYGYGYSAVDFIYRGF